MAVTPASIKTRFAAFADTDDAALQAAIDDATLILGDASSDWGTRYDMAVTLYAAHLAILDDAIVSEADGDGVGGAIKSATVGEVSVTYEIGSSVFTGLDEESGLGSTIYGQRFIALRAATFAGLTSQVG